MEVLQDNQVSPALAVFSAAIADYLAEIEAAGLDQLSDDGVLAELRELEVLRRRLAVADAALITQLDRRRLAGRLVMPSTGAVLQGVLRLSPYEAKGRVRVARACGPRVTVTGQRLPPLRPYLADAQAAGTVSGEHTRVILAALRALPATLSVEDMSLAEKHLVQAAATLRPREVGLVGQRILAHLHPDGVLPDAEQQRRRAFTLLPNADGSYTARGRLTPTCGALLLAWLSPRSAPRPATGSAHGGADSEAAASCADLRSPGQRMHDALEQLAGLAVRRTEPLDSGAPAQVIITITADQLKSRDGWAETSFGQLITVGQALKLADEAAISLLTRDATGAVLNHGRTKRIATRAQTLALIARDKGCSFPGCDKPPEWCQRHHIIAWADGGTTDLNNLTSPECTPRPASHLAAAQRESRRARQGNLTGDLAASHRTVATCPLWHKFARSAFGEL